MSRSATAAMAAHVAGSAKRLVRMLRLDLNDGTSIGITDHDEDLDYDLGDGALTYSARTGIVTSDISLACGLDPDTFEASGPIGSLVTRPAVLGGRFEGAAARLFFVNWSDLAMGELAMLSGAIADDRVEGGRFVFEIADSFVRFTQPVGELISNICRTTYGSPLCGATPEETTGTVTAVTDAMRFTVSYTGAWDPGFFTGGKAEAATGALAGTRPVEIVLWDDDGAASADVLLFRPLAEEPAIGDTFTITRGCPRTRTACMERGQILNFRGEPEVPGSDQVLRLPVPGGGGE